MEKCEFYPKPEEETCVCAAGSDVSGSFVCTKEYAATCYYAIKKMEENTIKNRFKQT